MLFEGWLSRSWGYGGEGVCGGRAKRGATHHPHVPLQSMEQSIAAHGSAVVAALSAARVLGCEVDTRGSVVEPTLVVGKGGSADCWAVS
jgi:hypothetical protein